MRRVRIPSSIFGFACTLFLTLASVGYSQQSTVSATGEVVVRTGGVEHPWVLVAVDEILDPRVARVSMGTIDKLYLLWLETPPDTTLETHLETGRFTWFGDDEQDQIWIRSLDGAYELTAVTGDEIWVADAALDAPITSHFLTEIRGISTYEGMQWSVRELAEAEDLQIPDDLPRLFLPADAGKSFELAEDWTSRALEDCAEFNQPRDCSVTCDLGSCSCNCKLGYCGCCKCVGFGPVLETPMCLCGPSGNCS